MFAIADVLGLLWQRMLYIQNLPHVTTEDLWQYFSQFGRVTQAIVVDHFGFVTFVDVNGSKSALAHESHSLQGRQISVQLAKFKQHFPVNISHVVKH